MHEMSVKTKYYNLLKSGLKTMELRLYDDKRKQIKIGDIIKFNDSSNDKDIFLAKVKNLHFSSDFNNLCDIIKPAQAGFETKDNLIKALEEFYPLNRQAQYGVIGIEIDLSY